MDFVIHSELIGSKQHLSSEGLWIDDLSECKWVVGKSSPEKNLLTALMLSGKKVEIEPPKLFSKIMNNFAFRENVPWQMIMPEKAYREWVTEVIEKVSKAFSCVDLSYHENVFKKSCEVLEALRPMKIHGKKWDYLASHDIQGVSLDVIDSFEPYEDGFADELKYSMTSTTTGRLIVKSGPEILRLNKELKTIIKSRFKGGKIIQFDYVSLEPRLALVLAGHGVSDDIYTDINQMVFDGKFSRDVVKVSTLSVMYGAGASSLEEKTGFTIKECKAIIKELKEFFGIYEMAKKLTKEYRSKKYIRNHFGRAIYPDSGAGHKLYNNFIQSSAIDCAMLGFWNIIQLWKNNDVVPIFVIHDNLGLDFHPSLLTNENIEKTKDVGAKIPNLCGKLLLGHDKI